MTSWRVESSGYFLSQPKVASCVSGAWRSSNKITTLCARDESSDPCFQELQRSKSRTNCEQQPARGFYPIEADVKCSASTGRAAAGNNPGTESGSRSLAPTCRPRTVVSASLL